MGAGGGFTSSALSRFVVLKFGLRVVVEGKKIGLNRLAISRVEGEIHDCVLILAKLNVD